MLLNSAWLLRSERPCVLKGLWAIYLERERQRAFRPSFFFGAQKETTNDSFLKSREEGLICFLAVETLEEHRPEQRWLCCSWFSHSYSRIRWSTAKNVFEENKLFNLFFSTSIQWMLDEKWMNVTDYRMHEWICVQKYGKSDKNSPRSRWIP